MNAQNKLAFQNSYQPFVIVSLARTGSTYLESLISSHPDILTFREIFGVRKSFPGYRGLVYFYTLFHKPNVHHAFKVLFHKNFNLIRALIFRSPVQTFLSTLLFGSYPSAIKGVGFKYHLYHGTRLPELKEYLRQHKEIKIVHLIRKNYLHLLVSEKLAQASSQWKLRNKTMNKARDIRFFLKKAECENTFLQREKQEKDAEALFPGHDILIINYEDLVHNQEWTLDRVQEFLGVQKRHLSSPLKKQRTRRLSEVIENYESLKHSFKGTRWSVFFNE